MSNNVKFIPDEEDREMVARVKPLATYLQRFIGKPFTGLTLTAIDEAVQVYGKALRDKGIHFPQLRAVVVPSRGWIDIARADLDEFGVMMVIENLRRRFKGIADREILPAVERAYPHYKALFE